MTFEVFAEEFFKKRQVLVLANELSPPSLKSDKIRFNKSLPFFYGRNISEISPAEVDKFLDSLILDGKSPATRNRYRALFHCYFKHAVRCGYITSNPVTQTRVLSEKLKKRKTDYLRTEQEIERYLKAAKSYDRTIGVAAAILCFGGCRIGEALALCFDDIEWNLGYIRIRKIVERHTGQIVKRTKSQRAGGEYQIIMVPRLKKILIGEWIRSKRSHDFILQTRQGKHFTYDVFHKIHKKIVKRAKIKHITIHDLRRTFASQAAKAGFHHSEVGELLGHETLKSTLSYTKKDLFHLIEKAKRIGFGKKM